MRIGGYYIKGISKRFWFILAATVFLIFIAITMWPKSADPMAEWNSGQVSMVDTLKKGADGNSLLKEICPNRSEACITALAQPAPSLENMANMGRPFRIRAFLPGEDIVPDQSGADQRTLKETRPSLFSSEFSEFGWSFRPAVILGYDGLTSTVLTESAGDADALSSAVADAFIVGEDGQLGSGDIVLGFDDQTGSLQPGLYDIDGILFGTSNALTPSKPPSEPYFSFPSPVLLVTKANYIGIEEALNPAEQIVRLNVSYQVGNRYRLRLDQLEWPGSGKRPRLCLSLSNISSKQQQIWAGFQDIAMSIDSVSQPADVTETDFDAAGDGLMQPNGSPLTDYLLFGQEDESGTAFSGTIDTKSVLLSIPSLINNSFTDTSQANLQISGVNKTLGQEAMPVETIGDLSSEAAVPPLGTASRCSR